MFSSIHVLYLFNYLAKRSWEHRCGMNTKPNMDAVTHHALIKVKFYEEYMGFYSADPHHFAWKPHTGNKYAIKPHDVLICLNTL